MAKKKKAPEKPADGGTLELENGEATSGYSLQQIADALGEEMLKKSEKPEEKPAAPAPAADEAMAPNIRELEEEVKRLVAENRNQKVRLENDLRTKLKFSNELFFREFILVKDDLEKAISFAPDGADERIAAFVQGIRHLDQAVTALLRRHGVEAYDALGQTFDPAIHEAMRVADVAGAEANTVTVQHLKGYRLFERILRPAMVEVASGKEPAAQKPAEEAQNEEKTETNDTEESNG